MVRRGFHDETTPVTRATQVGTQIEGSQLNWNATRESQ